MNELLKIFLHIVGFAILYVIIDYKRKDKIVRLSTKEGWIIILAVTMCATLISI